MNSKELKILWIVPKWPLPPTDGARLAICNLVSAIGKDSDFQVSLLALCGSDETVEVKELTDRFGVEEVLILTRRATPASIFRRGIQMLASLLLSPTQPVTMRNYSSENLRQGILKILKDQPWDLIIFDTLHSAFPVLRCKDDLRKIDIPICYRAHNHEQGIWKSRARRSRWILPRVFFEYQYRLLKALEDRFVSEADALFCVSQQDLERFSTLSGGAGKCFNVPIGVEFRKIPVSWDPAPIQLTFLGKLDWPPNFDGLIWFLQKIWPAVAERRGDIYLSIVGSGHAANLKNMCDTLPRVQFRGFVEDLQAVMHKTDAFIVPIFYGSGTRVKVIQAASAGRCCISTALGVEGLEFSENCHYFRAESEKQWISLLTKLTRSELLARGSSVYDYLEQDFDQSFIGKKLQFQLSRLTESLRAPDQKRVNL